MCCTFNCDGGGPYMTVSRLHTRNLERPISHLDARIWPEVMVLGIAQQRPCKAPTFDLLKAGVLASASQGHNNTRRLVLVRQPGIDFMRQRANLLKESKLIGLEP